VRNLLQFMYGRREPHQDETARDGDAAGHQQGRTEPGFVTATPSPRPNTPAATVMN